MGDRDNSKTNKWVINMSSSLLTEVQRALLTSGPNFVVVSGYPLKENI